MKLFPRKSGPESGTGEVQEARLADCEARCRWYAEALQTLLSTLRSLLEDAAEADACRDAIDALSTVLADETDPQKLTDCWTERNDAVLSFFERERRRQQDREKEYKDIIAMLTKASWV